MHGPCGPSPPVRIALIEALTLGGAAMTATEVGERIGESPTTCSFHLRQLAKYGFVEEAGGRKGRSRPWRMTSIRTSFTSTHDDPEAQIAFPSGKHLPRHPAAGASTPPDMPPPAAAGEPRRADKLSRELT